MPDGDAHQDAVDRHFDTTAQVWADYYRVPTVEGTVYRARQRAALTWLDGLGLHEGARALDAGCGAGELTAALAERGLSVDAVDSSAQMVAQVEARNLPNVRVASGDVNALAFPDENFDVVMALGVLPWVPTPLGAVHEMTRVLRPGGHAVLTVDNSRRLTYLLDPRLTPAAQSLKRAVRRGRGGPIHSVATTDDLNGYIATAGLERIAWRTIGFGPFTMLALPIIPGRLGIRVHERLQELADKGGALRTRGAHYMVLARRPLRS
jgi:ubiquinone/menaquinone biosynthesis C-methylase UbiE